MKDLSIEKLDERNTGNYHIIRKMNEVIESINELVKFLQRLEESGILVSETQDPDSSD